MNLHGYREHIYRQEGIRLSSDLTKDLPPGSRDYAFSAFSKVFEGTPDAWNFSETEGQISFSSGLRFFRRSFHSRNVNFIYSAQAGFSQVAVSKQSRFYFDDSSYLRERARSSSPLSFSLSIDSNPIVIEEAPHNGPLQTFFNHIESSVAAFKMAKEMSVDQNWGKVLSALPDLKTWEVED